MQPEHTLDTLKEVRLDNET